MKIIKKEKREVTIVVGFQCDICNKKYTNHMEMQEFILIHGIGGYGAVIGDGTAYNVDICQHCFKEKLGQFLTTKELW